MRTTPVHALVRPAGAVVALLLLGGCTTGAADGGAGDPSATASSTQPASATPPPPSALPTATATGAPAATPVPTDVGEDVLLPASALQPTDGPREVSDGVEAWVTSTRCDLGSPVGAADMVSVRQGDGMFEVPVGVHQVAVFDDPAAAQAEAERVAAAAAACAAAPPAGEGDLTRYLVTPLAVGAQGTSLVTDYYGATADDPSADGVGDAVAVTRRGTAVVLVGAAGGEDSMGAARARVAGYAQQAWERLCRYQVDGCA